MRPLGLVLEGFAAFRERTTVDFRDTELFAIVGATGHGKSSLIDAISFALYGKVPRHGERDIAPVMTLGCNKTSVSFTFELAGATYVATRILGRNASGDGAATKAMRLELVHDDGTTDILAGKKNEFDDAVRRLVGLDFEQFTKCVVLPQGQFASFLHARAGDRVAILSALLDLGRYDRMAIAARERGKRAAGAREALGAERARLGDATVAARDLAEARCSGLTGLRTDLDAAAPRDLALAAEVSEARAGADDARRAETALAAMHVPDDLREVVQQIDDAAGRRRTRGGRGRRGRSAGDQGRGRARPAAAARRSARRGGRARRTHGRCGTDRRRARSSTRADAAAAVAAKDALVAAREAVERRRPHSRTRNTATRTHRCARRCRSASRVRSAIRPSRSCRPNCGRPSSKRRARPQPPRSRNTMPPNKPRKLRSPPSRRAAPCSKRSGSRSSRSTPASPPIPT